MSKNQTSDLVPVETPADEKWASAEDAFAYLQHSMVLVMANLARFMWEVGQVATWQQENAEYGDGIVDKLADLIHRKKTWIYECIKMHNTYDWKTVEEKFIQAGVPASSIARLASIDDASTRNYVEDQLISGVIHYDDITKAKKQFEAQVNDVEHGHEEMCDGAEASMEELKAQQRAGEDSEDSRYATAMRSYFGAMERECDEMIAKLDDKLFAAVDMLAMIADEGLNDLSRERMVRAGIKMKKLSVYLTNAVGTIALHSPEEFQEESE
jgi:hypothetical protein